MFSYSAYMYAVRWTPQSTLHVTHWQTCSIRHQLDFSGKLSSHAAITHDDYSLTFPPPSRYSFIQLSELRASQREWKWPSFETVAKGFKLGISWSRVRYATAERPRSIEMIGCVVRRMDWKEKEVAVGKMTPIVTKLDGWIELKIDTAGLAKITRDSASYNSISNKKGTK